MATTSSTTVGSLLEQTAPDGTATTFQYRGNHHVGTTVPTQLSSDPAGHEIKQWQGSDETAAAQYHDLGNGDYTLADSTGTTEYTKDGHLVEQTAPDGTTTTFQYRGDQYVGTTGDEHVLYDASGNEIKQWQGDDESKAQIYQDNHNGTYTLRDPQEETSTTYNKADSHLISQVNKDGSVTTFAYRGNQYVGTTG